MNDAWGALMVVAQGLGIRLLYNVYTIMLLEERYDIV